jgi:hypothetical protein
MTMIPEWQAEMSDGTAYSFIRTFSVTHLVTACKFECPGTLLPVNLIR